MEKAKNRPYSEIMKTAEMIETSEPPAAIKCVEAIPQFVVHVDSPNPTWMSLHGRACSEVLLCRRASLRCASQTR